MHRSFSRELDSSECGSQGKIHSESHSQGEKTTDDESRSDSEGGRGVEREGKGLAEIAEKASFRSYRFFELPA